MCKTPFVPDRDEGGFPFAVENETGGFSGEKIADDLRFFGW